jgi:FkbM family methyltransferase
VAEHDLLFGLTNTPVALNARTLCVVGAHIYEERAMLVHVFPNVVATYLFEAEPRLALALRNQAIPGDVVFEYALCDTNGTLKFNVASNNASSSLLDFADHTTTFPGVAMTGQIEVQARTLDSVLAEYGVSRPDVLFMDIQGAEYLVLKSLEPETRRALQVIYCEVSDHELYRGQKRLVDISALLEPEFEFRGFTSMADYAPGDGNALWVRRAE